MGNTVRPKIKYELMQMFAGIKAFSPKTFIESFGRASTNMIPIMNTPQVNVA